MEHYAIHNADNGYRISWTEGKKGDFIEDEDFLDVYKTLAETYEAYQNYAIMCANEECFIMSSDGKYVVRYREIANANLLFEQYSFVGIALYFMAAKRAEYSLAHIKEFIKDNAEILEGFENMPAR